MEQRIQIVKNYDALPAKGPKQRRNVFVCQQIEFTGANVMRIPITNLLNVYSNRQKLHKELVKYGRLYVLEILNETRTNGKPINSYRSLARFLDLLPRFIVSVVTSDDKEFYFMIYRSELL